MVLLQISIGPLLKVFHDILAVRTLMVVLQMVATAKQITSMFGVFARIKNRSDIYEKANKLAFLHI